MCNGKVLHIIACIFREPVLFYNTPDDFVVMSRSLRTKAIPRQIPLPAHQLDASIFHQEQWLTSGKLFSTPEQWALSKRTFSTSRWWGSILRHGSWHVPSVFLNREETITSSFVGIILYLLHIYTFTHSSPTPVLGLTMQRLVENSQVLALVQCIRTSKQKFHPYCLHDRWASKLCQIPEDIIVQVIRGSCWYSLLSRLFFGNNGIPPQGSVTDLLVTCA